MINSTSSQVKQEACTVEGTAVNLFTAGDGEPLLYLHGPEGGGWHPFLTALAKNFRVLAPEHPGFGGTAMPEWLDNIHDIAFFYRSFLRQTVGGQAHVVGSFLGAWIALEIATKDNRDIASLSLIAPAGFQTPGIRKPDTFLWPPEEYVRHSYLDKAIADRLLKEPMTPEHEDISLGNRFATARLAWQPRYFDPHLHKWVHHIDRPIQVIWGNEDEVFPVAAIEVLKKIIPHARYVTIPRCGHLPQIEKPDLFVQNIEKFVQEIKP